MLVFVEGGKPEIPEKNLRSNARTNNKLNPHETATSTGIDPGSQRSEASAYPLRHTCSPNHVCNMICCALFALFDPANDRS